MFGKYGALHILFLLAVAVTLGVLACKPINPGTGDSNPRPSPTCTKDAAGNLDCPLQRGADITSDWR